MLSVDQDYSNINSTTSASKACSDLTYKRCLLSLLAFPEGGIFDEGSLFVWFNPVTKPGFYTFNEQKTVLTIRTSTIALKFLL